MVPRPAKHECPYGGERFTSPGAAPVASIKWITRCGETGWLCERCQQDKLDARTEKLADLLRELSCHLDGVLELSRRLMARELDQGATVRSASGALGDGGQAEMLTDRMGVAPVLVQQLPGNGGLAQAGRPSST